MKQHQLQTNAIKNLIRVPSFPPKSSSRQFLQIKRKLKKKGRYKNFIKANVNLWKIGQWFTKLKRWLMAQMQITMLRRTELSKSCIVILKKTSKTTRKRNKCQPLNDCGNQQISWKISHKMLMEKQKAVLKNLVVSISTTVN